MADQHDSTQEASIREVFSLFDVDGSGSISSHEFEAAMRCLGKTPTDDDLGEADDGKGNITEANFLKLMKRKMSEEENGEEMFEAFKVFDRDGYGTLRASDLHQAMTNLGGNLTDREASDILKDADIDNDSGETDYKDLVKMVMTPEDSTY